MFILLIYSRGLNGVQMLFCCLSITEIVDLEERLLYQKATLTVTLPIDCKLIELVVLFSELKPFHKLSMNRGKSCTIQPHLGKKLFV